MDVNTAAYRVVQIATEQAIGKSPAKTRAGRIGGIARAKSLTVKKRKAIARKANRARWDSPKPKGKNADRIA